MKDYKDTDFTQKPIDNLGKFGIHPLNEQGFDLYISPDFYNYHYLKNTENDPVVRKQMKEKAKKEMEDIQNNMINNQNMNQNNLNQENNYNETLNYRNEKNQNLKKRGKNFIGDYYQVTYTNKKTSFNPYLVKKKKKNLKNTLNKESVGLTVGKKSGSKLVSHENTIHGNMPTISHVNDGHGNLRTYPAPHIN